VFDVRAAFPELSIVGVGGVRSGADALQLLMAGAQAVQVGTATFADPRAVWRIAADLANELAKRGIEQLDQVVGIAHRGGWT
jgi:dihydroorotate dehydrogenase (NAD+) catalytic subunit